MIIPEVRTARLVLRGWSDHDRELFAAMNADPRVMEYFTQLLTRAESDAFVDQMERTWTERGYGLWAVERRDLSRFIGFVGLWPAEFDAPFTPAVEVGWRLAAQDWGHGFATEAAREALRHGFVGLGLDEIVSMTTARNLRSQRVMRRLGMTRDAIDDFEHPRVPAGHPLRPHVLYRLPRGQWHP